MTEFMDKERFCNAFCVVETPVGGSEHLSSAFGWDSAKCKKN
jgi:hypothetical protein